MLATQSVRRQYMRPTASPSWHIDSSLLATAISRPFKLAYNLIPLCGPWVCLEQAER